MVWKTHSTSELLTEPFTAGDEERESLFSILAFNLLIVRCLPMQA